MVESRPRRVGQTVASTESDFDPSFHFDATGLEPLQPAWEFKGLIFRDHRNFAAELNLLIVQSRGAGTSKKRPAS